MRRRRSSTLSLPSFPNLSAIEESVDEDEGLGLLEGFEFGVDEDGVVLED